MDYVHAAYTMTAPRYSDLCRERNFPNMNRKRHAEAQNVSVLKARDDVGVFAILRLRTAVSNAGV